MEKICSRCKKSKSVLEFSLKHTSSDGRNSRCKECVRYYAKRHYRKHRQYYIDKSAKRRREVVELIRRVKEDSHCAVCGEGEVSCLDFHHTDPLKKDVDIGRVPPRGWSNEKVLREIEGCVVLCSNCHRKLHAGVITLDR
jgi:hypothetical protein